MQEKLKEEFGYGFALILAPESDCSDADQIAFFCEKLKALSSDITTIVVGDASHYIPFEEEERLFSLTDEWQWEPYNSAEVISGINAAQRQSSQPAELKNGIDYIVNQYGRSHFVKSLIADLLDASINMPDVPAEEKIIDTLQSEKIQKIADEALTFVMSPDFELTDRGVSQDALTK